jgi:hypothetical protein
MTRAANVQRGSRSQELWPPQKANSGHQPQTLLAAHTGCLKMSHAAVPLELHFKYGGRTSIVSGQGLFPSLDVNQLTAGMLKALLAQTLHILPGNQTLRLGGWRALPQEERIMSASKAAFAFDADREVLFHNDGEGKALKDEEALGSLYVMDKLVVKVSVSAFAKSPNGTYVSCTLRQARSRL